MPEDSSRWSYLARGFLAGIVGRALVAPLDVLKIRFQVQNLNNVKYTGFIAGIRTIVKEESFYGFWKGNVAGSVLYASYATVQFAVYDFLRTELTFPNPFIAGSVAAVAGTLITYPFDLLRSQVAIMKHKVSYLDYIRELYKTRGMAGFYSGYLPTIFQIVPYMGLNFFTYEMLRKDPHLTNAKNVVYGGISGMISKFLTLPLDVLKRRLQIQYMNPTMTVYSRLPHIGSLPFLLLALIKDIYRNEGIPGFFKGGVPGVFKAFLGSSVAFGIYYYQI